MSELKGNLVYIVRRSHQKKKKKSLAELVMVKSLRHTRAHTTRSRYVAQTGLALPAASVARTVGGHFTTTPCLSGNRRELVGSQRNPSPTHSFCPTDQIP